MSDDFLDGFIIGGAKAHIIASPFVLGVAIVRGYPQCAILAVIMFVGGLYILIAQTKLMKER